MSHTDVKTYVDGLKELASKVEQVKVMEVCGTHTVSFFRSGVKSLLPDNLHLISGPGCPVCVTSQGYLDAACAAARMDNVVIATYGDMVRVPGREGSLEELRGEGAEILVVYSARDALLHAIEHPNKKVVFLGVGFETTAPATAATIIEAKTRNVENFCVLMGHKLVMPAMEALLSAGEVAIDGFILPGHVSVIIGIDAYGPLADKFQKPSVITGFEPLQLVKGLSRVVELVQQEEVVVDNVYGVAVRQQGNKVALKMMEQVFQPGYAVWRALGTIPESGLDLREEFSQFDALKALGLEEGPDYEPPGCRCGEVIQGKVTPAECTLFAKKCTPMDPVGPCMVSSEGTCAAWYKYGRHQAKGR